MNRRNLIVLGVALLLGLFAVILANAYFSGVEERQEAIAQEQQLTRIVVATQPLEFGMPLSAENIRLQNFPASSVPEGAFRTLEAALQGGRVALRPIVPGEPILASKVSGSGGRAVLSANLPEGMRAVTISINDVTGVAGFARPGDTVDVLLTRKIPGDGADSDDLMTTVIMERVPLLAIGQVASENATEPKPGKTATVQVDLFGAQKLAIAAKIGTMSLALRNIENDTPQAGPTVTTRDLGEAALYIAPREEGRMANANYAPPPSAPAASTASSGPPPRVGPSMTIYRGTDGAEYPVDRKGGR